MQRLFILAALLLSLCGCAMILVGAGAAGGYAIGKDYIQGESDKNFDSVYSSAVETTEIIGMVESKFRNPSIAKIRARVENSSLEIVVERLTRSTVRLRVKSRKNLMPNIELAQKVYNKILQSAR
jgi:hypothetical protein